MADLYSENRPSCVTLAFRELSSKGLTLAAIIDVDIAGGCFTLLAQSDGLSLEDRYPRDTPAFSDTVSSKTAMLINPGDNFKLPEQWSAQLEHGPILIIPLVFANTDSLARGGECDVGVLAIFSTGERTLASGDLATGHQVGKQLTNDLFLYKRLVDLKWYRQAHRTFNSTTTKILSDTLWQEASGPSLSAQLSTRKTVELADESAVDPEDPASEHAEQLRRLIADRSVPILMRGLRLERCAILTPMTDAPHFWYYLSHEGFPSEVVEERNFYIRGQGLTGETLLLQREQPPIESPDVEHDARWSRNGKTLRRGPNDNGPMAFIGIPIYSQFSNADPLPYAALVCCRFQGSYRQSPAFTDKEKRHLQHIASQLSYGFDVIRWRHAEKQRQQRQLQLSRLWTTHLSDDQKLEHALVLLQAEGSFKRILLALVTPDRKQIVGKAVWKFRKSLITDTVRSIHNEDPKNPLEEDILALIVRKQMRHPFSVTPNDPNDTFSPHIDRYTAGRHGVTNRLMLIPLINEHSLVSGVVLAEFPDGTTRISHEDEDRFAVYAHQLSCLIAQHSWELTVRQERVLFERLLSCFEQRRMSEPVAVESLLRDMIQGLCDVYGFDRGLAYLFDDDARLLKGAVGVGLNELGIKQTAYSIDLDSETAFEDCSFASHVHRVRHPVFLPSMAESPVDTIDRDRVGIDSECCGLGVPLALGTKCYGVLILCGRGCRNPLFTSDREIREYGCLGALVIALKQAEEKLAAADRLHELQDVCIQHVGRFSQEPAGESQALRLPDGDRAALRDFAKEAADLLRAKRCAIFTPDHAIEVPISKQSENGRRPWSSGIPFLLRASCGYPDDLLDNVSYSYSDHVKGLTSTVLRTLESNSTKNVEGDKRWSRRLANAADEQFPNANRLRAWIGTPIIFSEADRRFVYGVLTFTRGRLHPRDTAFFDDADQIVAERLAWLLAVGFHTRQSVGRMYDNMKGRLRSFLHSVRFPLDLVQRDRLGQIRRMNRKNGNDPTISALCSKMELDLRFINAGFSAFTDFTKDDAEWLDYVPETNVQDVVKTVFHIAKTLSSQVALHEPLVTPEDLKCRIDSSRLVFILHALVENAIKAAREVKFGEVWTEISRSNSPGNPLFIVVRDNGCGISERDHSKIYEEGYSGFPRPSSGLGLSLVKRFVDANVGGEIECVSNSSEGTVFKVKLMTG